MSQKIKVKIDGDEEGLNFTRSAEVYTLDDVETLYAKILNCIEEYNAEYETKAAERAKHED